MKPLLVITKGDIGGAQSFVLTLATGLKKMSNVAVAAGEGEFLADELKKREIDFFRLGSLKRNKNPFTLLSFILELKTILNHGGYDVLHLNSTNALPGVLAARLSKIKPKVIFTIHGLSVLDCNYQASKIIKLIFKWYYRFFLSFVDELIFVSKYNYIEALNQRLTKKGSIIYNGIDVGNECFIEKSKARTELEKLIKKDLSNNILFGSVGRLATQKNYDFIIKIWPEIKKIVANPKFIIIGEGPEREKYQKLIKEVNAGDDIYLPGEIKDASKLLKGFDLFVLPSIYEGLSISLIEALFSGVPALASDVGGNREILGAENCFNLNDKEMLFEKIKKGVTNSLIDKNIFRADYMIKKYLDIYEV